MVEIIANHNSGRVQFRLNSFFVRPSVRPSVPYLVRPPLDNILFP